MGIMLTGFLGGAAKGITESIEDEEKRASTMAQMQAKAMFDNYNRVKEQNDELSNKLKGGINYLKSNGIKGSEEEYYKAAKNPQLLTLLQKKVEAGDFDPNNIKLGELVGEVQPLMGKTAEQAINNHYDLSQQVYKKPDATKQPQGFIKGFGDVAAEDTFNRTATMLGVSPDILRATAQYKRPDIAVDNTYNLKSLYSNKTMPQLKDEAEGKLVAARKSGNADEIAKALADVKVISVVQEEFQSAAQKFMNMTAGYKDKQLNGTPQEKAEATVKLKQIYAQEREEALAKHVRETSDKVPALSPLNSFVAGSVNRALITQFGSTGKDFIDERVDNGDNTFSIRMKYIGTDDKKKAEVQRVQAMAAREALSTWIDPEGRPLSRDVLAVAKSYPMPDARRLGEVPVDTQQPVATENPFKQRTDAARKEGNLGTLIQNATGAGMSKEKLLATGVTEEEYNQYAPKVIQKPMTMSK